jgi:hypothetical protein
MARQNPGGTPLRDDPRLPSTIPSGSTRGNRYPGGIKHGSRGSSAANTPGTKRANIYRPQRGRITVCDPSGIEPRCATNSGGSPLRGNPRLPSAIPSGSSSRTIHFAARMQSGSLYRHTWKRPCRHTIPFITTSFFLPNIENLGSLTNGLRTCMDTSEALSKALMRFHSKLAVWPIMFICWLVAKRRIVLPIWCEKSRRQLRFGFTMTLDMRHSVGKTDTPFFRSAPMPVPESPITSSIKPNIIERNRR